MRQAALVSVLALAGSSAPAGVAAAPIAMRLAVNTHFDQGWPRIALDQVTQAHAHGIRDTVSWGKVERTPGGGYDFTDANSGYVAAACRSGQSVLLTLTPRNPAYEGGMTVTSVEGRAAFAAFAAALADRFPCIDAFEIGNEINAHSLKGPILDQMPGGYIAIVDAVRAAVRVRHPRIAVLSGSSLSVGTGFFKRLMDAGLLRVVDGIAVHPYMQVPEQLPRQLARLRAAMDAAGGRDVGLWASEVGFYYPTPEAAPSHALKTLTILSAAHVVRADWYALRDEPWYPNMGLFKGAAQPKPALATFRLATDRLLPSGNARRIDAGDQNSFVYRFGQGLYVLWGAGRPIRFRGQASAWNAVGQPVALPTMLGADPLVVEAPDGFDFGPARVIDDSILNFGGAGWSYRINRAGQGDQPLDWIDWNWNSYIGSSARPNFRAAGLTLSNANNGGPPTRLVERYSFAEGGRYVLLACFVAKPERPQSIAVLRAGRTLWSADVTGEVQAPPLPVEVRAGDSIDITYSAETPGGPQPLRRRIVIAVAGSGVEPACPPVPATTPAGVPAPQN